MRERVSLPSLLAVGTRLSLCRKVWTPKSEKPKRSVRFRWLQSQICLLELGGTWNIRIRRTKKTKPPHEKRVPNCVVCLLSLLASPSLTKTLFAENTNERKVGIVCEVTRAKHQGLCQGFWMFGSWIKCTRKALDLDGCGRLLVLVWGYTSRVLSGYLWWMDYISLWPLFFFLCSLTRARDER